MKSLLVEFVPLSVQEEYAMPMKIGNIELYMGPKEVGGPDDLKGAIIGFIKGANKMFGFTTFLAVAARGSPLRETTKPQCGLQTEPESRFGPTERVPETCSGNQGTAVAQPNA